MLKDDCYELQFGDLSEATHGQPVTPSCFRVSIENTTVVPPRSEALVAGKIVSQYAPVLGLLEPMARLEGSQSADASQKPGGHLIRDNCLTGAQPYRLPFYIV